jgi:hypothetical protein
MKKKKHFKSTRVNPTNLWPELWDYNNLIKRKLKKKSWSIINNQLNVYGWKWLKKQKKI